MDRLLLAMELGEALEQFGGIPQPHEVAQWWVEKESDRAVFFNEQDKNTLRFMQSVTDTDDIQNLFAFVSAFINGKTNIEQVYEYLLNFYDKGTLRKYYQRNSDVFSLKKKEVEDIVNYLQSIGLTMDEIKEILLEGIRISLDDLQERVELALDIFDDVHSLLFLVKERLLFLPQYYHDSKEALKTIRLMYGSKLSKVFLEDDAHTLFLHMFKQREYQRQYIHDTKEVKACLDHFRNDILDSIDKLDSLEERKILHFHFADKNAKSIKETADAFSIDEQKVESMIEELCNVLKSQSYECGE